MRTKVVAVLVALILAVPLVTKAQYKAAKIPPVGLLSVGTIFADGLPTLDGFRQGPRDLGYVEGGYLLAAAGALILVLALNLLRVDHVV